MTLEILRQQYEILMAESGKWVDNFPWEESSAYAMWLKQSYSFVRHSTRLLALASAHAKLEDDNLHRRMAEHLREESGHEKMALNDIKQLGFDHSIFPELAETRAFFQCQYFWIQNRSAAAFFGYILFLEGFGVNQGPRILKRTNYFGNKSNVFVKVHAEEDQEHIVKAFDALKHLDEDVLLEISQNMSSSAKLYKSIIAESKKQRFRDTYAKQGQHEMNEFAASF